MTTDTALSYNFDAIEYSVRQEIHTTSARFNAALEELRSRIAPLQQLWTREAAAAYQLEQLRWHQAASALNEILVDLGNAVRDGAEEVAQADRRAAGSWGR
ncbi:WXG100 type VII secretion target family protein [Mycobacterium kansasii 732]|uniref:ESAT-6-like protein n=1 Tax=Mycobacterium pseudokansasii TaxID=2341080 RepID=A0A498QLI4_9MYCO|nr:WXG100 family type VII secretion target [Mycobacterium pseudokansasii]EUA14805.1 WXG100 type VII secretion target family protein [Mycobacterium kansasii 732]KZS64987.1 type VII secretion protein EsxT [Mycobacterium kansasii]MBY0387573.1 WXG100 family type VII secretion target [Mycobacterium pseudokansasii]VAZ90124.1 ESAT-6-like protein EsxT [Mycobacterium pseudokansasii]VAZ90916.1 ESAT-6-like protein EsxT [Mycobacterium pseudokansasii]